MRAPSRPPMKSQMARSWMCLAGDALALAAPAGQPGTEDEGQEQHHPEAVDGDGEFKHGVQMGMRNSTCCMGSSTSGCEEAGGRPTAHGITSRPTAEDEVERGSHPTLPLRLGFTQSSRSTFHFGGSRGAVNRSRPPGPRWWSSRSIWSILLELGEQLAALLLPDLPQVMRVVAHAPAGTGQASEKALGILAGQQFRSWT